MKEQKLFDAITNINDEFILEAITKKLEKRNFNIVYPSIIAATLVLAFGISSFISNNIGGSSSTSSSITSSTTSGSSGSMSDITYMSYAGPIFPLNAQNSEDITAERNITFDFAVNPEINVQDSYILTNSTENDIVIQAEYPFISDLEYIDGNIPSISINNEEVTAELSMQQNYPIFNGEINFNSFADFEELLNDINLDKIAFTGNALEDIPVKIYEFSDYGISEDMQTREHENIEFNLDREKTVVLSYGFNSGGFDESEQLHGFSVPSSEDETDCKKYLIIIGDDIENYTLYREIGDIQVESECKITETEGDIKEALNLIIEDYKFLYLNHESTYSNDDILMYSTLYELENYLNFGNTEYNFELLMLDELLHHVFYSERVLYLNFDITIPAGESVNIDISSTKEPSFNFAGSGKNEQSNGYELATTLGSSIDFTKQTAKVINLYNGEIQSQNFGFDIENGINEVVLDENVNTYYMEVYYEK